MSELKQTKTALIVTASLTIILLISLATGFIPKVGNLQILVFMMFFLGLFMTFCLIIKYAADWLNENW